METASGKKLHEIGIGTWGIASRRDPDKIMAPYGAVEAVQGNEPEEIAGIRYSISKSQNHIDCAELYGAFYTDEVVGQALDGLNRKDLYIGDKLWKNSVEKDMVRPTVERMLTKLKTTYIDLLYIHSPWEGVAWQDAIPQIDQLIDEGIVRYFGVSNFTIENMQKAMAISKHPLSANQMNYNVLYQDEVPREFRDFCKEHGIQIVAYQPLKRQEVNASPVVQAIAEAHQATSAQVALAWLIQMGTLPIPKALKKEHIDENLGALKVTLSNNEMDKLTTS